MSDEDPAADEQRAGGDSQREDERQSKREEDREDERDGEREGDRDGGREDERQSERDGEGGEEGEDANGQSGPTTAELALTAISVTFTVLLVGFLVWQALTTPVDAVPEASVVEVTQTGSGERQVDLEIVNRGSRGLLSASVEVDCGASSQAVTFDNVPADGIQRATVLCPAGSSPTANVTTYKNA